MQTRSIKAPRFPHIARLALTLALAASAGVALAQAPAPATPASSPAGTLTQAQIEAADTAGQRAATVWLNQLDAGMWGEAWDQASQLFKTNVPIGTWMDNVPKERGALGRATAREVSDTIVNTQMEGQPPGIYVSVLFDTTFPNQPPMQEIVSTRREADGRFRVIGYSRR